MVELFRYPYQVRFHDADPAGIAYFSNILRICHEAYEDWLCRHGIALSTLTGSRRGLPVVATSARFRAPLRLGQEVVVQGATGAVGHSTYSLSYRILDAQEQLLCEAETSHVHLDLERWRVLPLPEELRRALEG